MHGNIVEWCRDCYDEKFYAKAKNVDPENISESNTMRVLRGGSWGSSPVGCRAAFRLRLTSVRRYDLGFRVVIVSGSPVK
jgi:formylglycine-generating enzyme required for sulfatase activity